MRLRVRAPCCEKVKSRAVELSGYRARGERYKMLLVFRKKEEM